MFWDPSGLERGLAVNFAYDITPLFGVNKAKWDNSKKNIATLSLGWGSDKVVRDYNYNSGMAYIPKDNSYRDIVTVNSEGHMEMERTDFYDSIGLNYVEFRLEFTITKEHEIAEVALYTALGMAIGSEISSSINITNKVGAALGGLTSNIISGEIQSGLVLEAGNYVSEIILCDRPMEGNRNMYENVETVRVLKYATDINTGENVPIEIISDYRTRYTGMTEGSEVNKIKNEIKM